MKFILTFLISLSLLIACQRDAPIRIEVQSANSISISLPQKEIKHFLQNNPGSLEQQMIRKGLTRVGDIQSNLVVDLKYSTSDNITQKDLYGWLSDCYLQPDNAQMLANAQKYLDSLNPGYRIVIWDCARPLSVQMELWSAVKGKDKTAYVAYPGGGSMHNYGVAVDVSLIDSAGNLLDMGTGFDDMKPLAQPRFEQKYLRSGELSLEQLANRELLRKVMKAGGFWNIQSEWWHFNAGTMDQAKRKYTIIE